MFDGLWGVILDSGIKDMNRENAALDFNRVRNAVRRWPMNRKIQLVRELEDETWTERLDSVVRKIRRQAGTVSRKKISSIVERVRKRLYANGLRRS